MAFETVEEWKVERSFALSQVGVLAFPELPAQWPYQEKIAKLPSASLALLLNGLFFYFLIANAFDRSVDETDKPIQSKSTEMTMIALSDLQKPDDSSELDLEELKPATASSAGESPIDLTTETQLPPEWTIGRIRVSRVIVTAPMPDVLNGISPGADGGGKKGGGVYDPYAGAAPNRKPEEELMRGDRKPKQPSLMEQVSGFFGFGTGEGGIDSGAFEQLVQDLQRRLPRAKGSVELMVFIDSSGTVKSAEIVGGTASAQVKFFVRNAVVGKQVAGRRSAQQGGVKLPAIVFG